MKKFRLLYLFLALILLVSCASDNQPAPASTVTANTTPPQTTPPVTTAATTTPLPVIEYTLVPGNGADTQMYRQSFDAVELEGSRTSMQVSCSYSEMIHVNCDAVMIYSTSEAMVNSWQQQADTFTIDMMIAINRADVAWADAHPEAIQTKKDGSRMMHSTGGSYYMVPTADFIEYAWETVKWSIEQFHPATIAFEEPEMWNVSGYSQGFKNEWQAYFNEEWQDPASTPEALLKSMELKTYLFERIIAVMSERIHALSPDTKFYIATHSTPNYNAWGITAGLNHYMATGKLDGVIGQTWSDTIRTALPYAGDSVVDEYLNAYIDFASYLDSVEGTDFFALADPMSDDASAGEERNRYAYLQTIVASLMHPEIHRFEICPWTDRAFGNVSGTYRTILQQCFNALNEVGGLETTLEAGTPGIAFAVSDTISWLKNTRWSPTSSLGFYGVTVPLAAKGVPIGIKSMEQITAPADLADVSVLLLSYDIQLPMSEEVNIAIADWVKNGGTLLLLSGKNEYWDTAERFWSAAGSPVGDLFAKLGIDAKLQLSPVFDDQLTAEGIDDLSEVAAGISFSSCRRFGIAFETTATPLITANGQIFAFEQAVGNGHLLAVGLPSNYYSTENGSELLRALTARAVETAGLSYVETNLMTTRRGNFVAVHALAADDTLAGTYVDLFDPDLTVVSDPIVAGEDSRLLYAIDNFDRSIPRFAYSGGELVADSLAETATETSFAYTSAAYSFVSTRLLAPQGMYPAKVTAICDGKELSAIEIWDNATSSLLLKLEGSPKETVVTVVWGTTPVADGQSKTLVEKSVAVNERGADAPYLVYNTAFANSNLRFCDMDGQLVYCFNISAHPDTIFDLSIVQNYIVEVSPDGETWTMVADYSEGGTVPHLKDGSNATILRLTPADYGITESFYFRIRNSDTSMGWGGSLSRIAWRYWN